MTCRRLSLLFLAALLLASGCRSLGPPRPAKPAISQEALLARLLARQQTLKAFQAKGRITFLSPQQNYSGTAILTGQLPASLKVSVLDLLGRTALSFATDGTEVVVLDSRENRLRRGPATPQNLAAFIPPSVGLPQALRLLLGALPLSPGPPNRFSYQAAADRYLLEWDRDGQLQERLWVEAQGLNPVQEEWFGGAPEPRFIAELANFGALVPDLPEKITVKTPNPKIELRLTYSDLKLNPTLAPEDLTLTPPAGAVLAPLGQ
jgi:hypothetical protein